MRDKTEKNKYLNFAPIIKPGRCGVLVLALLMAGGSLLTAAPLAEGQMNVNNMHCAARWGGSTFVAVESGVPFHDHHNADLRGDCNGILHPPGLVNFHFSVGSASAKTYGELYLNAPGGQEIQGRVCLQLDGAPWECGLEQSWDKPEWEFFPDQLNIELPSATVPTVTEARVAFSTDGSCDGETNGLACDEEDAFNMYHYQGVSHEVGEIIDPSHDVDSNQYTEIVNFTFWRIHDPRGDDHLEIAGVPLTLEPGSKLDFPDSDMRVRYKAHPEEGNEWIVESISGDEIAFVWDDTQGTWEIRTLDYEGDPELGNPGVT